MAILQTHVNVGDTIRVQMVPLQREYVQMDYTGTMRNYIARTNQKQNVDQLAGIYCPISSELEFYEICVRSTSSNFAAKYRSNFNVNSGKRKRMSRCFLNAIQASANYHFVSVRVMVTLALFRPNQPDSSPK